MGDLVRKFLTVPVLVAGLGIVFLALSLLLLITKGNVRVLGAKLRVGALIIALQAIAVQGAWTAGSCYERPEPPPTVSIPESALDSDGIHLNLKESTEIRVTLHRSAYRYFRFQIAHRSFLKWQTVQSGKVVAIDGSENSSREEKAAMTIDPTKVPPGVYELRILWGNSQPDAEATRFATYRLIVVDE